MRKKTNIRPKILYLTHRDAKNKREWSGTLFFMAESLNRHAGEVVHAGPYNPKYWFFILKAINKISLLLFRKRYCIPYNYFLTKLYKYHFTRIIKRENPDIIFAAAASGEMSQLKVFQPKIYLGDITFNLLKDHYPNYQNLSGFSLWESEKIENRTFQKAAALVFSSEWAANSAKLDYKVPEDKINIIPYGANMDNVPNSANAINKKINGPFKLLFLGLDWFRKGGDTVFQSFIELREMGLDIELTVCGCIPPSKYKSPKMKIIPFLDKNKKGDSEKLFNLLLDTHLLFVPSKSDCTPIVFCEANAFGIPVITSDAGGIKSVIKNGVNGYTLSVDSKPSDYSKIIADLHNNHSAYSKLVKSSRQYYESFLNWDKWGESMSALINRIISKAPDK